MSKSKADELLTPLECLERDPLCDKYGLDALNNAGFIDSKTESKIDQVKLNLDDLKNRFSLPLYHESVHPVFRFDRFQDVTQGDYDNHLVPVVRLASCFLEDLSVLPFFHALLNKKLQPINDWQQKRHLEQDVYEFGIDSPVMNQGETRMTWQKLAELSKYVTWTFSDPQDASAYMVTERTFDKAWGTVPERTHSARILIRRRYLEVLTRTTTSRQMPLAQGFDPEDARLRVMVHMATCMCHELCHAIGNVYIQFKPGTWDLNDKKEPKKVPIPTEPFYRGHHVCELGWAYQQCVFKGIMEPIGAMPRADVHFAWGAYMDDIAYKRKAPHKHRKFERWDPGNVDRIYRPLLMKYFHEVFSKQFWEKRIKMEGLAALAPPPTDYFASSRLRTAHVKPNFSYAAMTKGKKPG